MEEEYMFKIVVVGDAGVGKTCLISRFADNTFGKLYLSNIGVEFDIRTVIIDGKQVKLQLWDTAGQERFRSISSAHYRGSTGIILAYDITDEKSLSNLEHTLNDISTLHSDPDNVCKLLVGTKCDFTDRRYTSARAETPPRRSYVEQLPYHFQQHASSSAHRLLQVEDGSVRTHQELREVDYIRAMEFAKKHKLDGAIETSAKESVNVELAFVTLAAAILEQKGAIKKQPDDPISSEISATNNSCCMV